MFHVPCQVLFCDTKTKTIIYRFRESSRRLENRRVSTYRMNTNVERKYCRANTVFYWNALHIIRPKNRILVLFTIINPPIGFLLWFIRRKQLRKCTNKREATAVDHRILDISFFGTIITFLIIAVILVLDCIRFYNGNMALKTADQSNTIKKPVYNHDPTLNSFFFHTIDNLPDMENDELPNNEPITGLFADAKTDGTKADLVEMCQEYCIPNQSTSSNSNKTLR